MILCVKVPSAVKAMYNKTATQQAADVAAHPAVERVLARVSDSTTNCQSLSAAAVTAMTGAVCDTMLKNAASHAVRRAAAEAYTGDDADDGAQQSQQQVCHMCVTE